MRNSLRKTKKKKRKLGKLWPRLKRNSLNLRRPRPQRKRRRRKRKRMKIGIQ